MNNDFNIYNKGSDYWPHFSFPKKSEDEIEKDHMDMEEIDSGAGTDYEELSELSDESSDEDEGFPVIIPKNIPKNVSEGIADFEEQEKLSPRPNKRMKIEEELIVAFKPKSDAININQFFQELKTKTEKQAKTFNNDHYLKFNEESCRFTDILCPRGTRVHVQGQNDTDYLHANHVHLNPTCKPCIATQYPLPAQESRLWHAYQEEEACLIVDLTNARDGLTPYAPQHHPLNDNLTTKSYSDFNVIVKDRQTVKGINSTDFYTYQMVEEGKDPGVIQRLHYRGWNDGAGATVKDLDELLKKMSEIQKDSSKPIIVHCRAGVGRSGTMLVAYAMKQMIEKGEVNQSNVKEELTRLILKGREQRGPAFVQSVQQLQTLWEWTQLAIQNKQEPV